MRRKLNYYQSNINTVLVGIEIEYDESTDLTQFILTDDIYHGLGQLCQVVKANGQQISTKKSTNEGNVAINSF